TAEAVGGSGARSFLASGGSGGGQVLTDWREMDEANRPGRGPWGAQRQRSGPRRTRALHNEGNGRAACECKPLHDFTDSSRTGGPTENSLSLVSSFRERACTRRSRICSTNIGPPPRVRSSVPSPPGSAPIARVPRRA